MGDQVKVKYYYNKLTNERIRVEPVIFLTAKGTNQKFNIVKEFKKIVKAHPDTAIVVDDFLSKKYAKELGELGCVSYLNFPTQMTYNINQRNSNIMI